MNSTNLSHYNLSLHFVNKTYSIVEGQEKKTAQDVLQTLERIKTIIQRGFQNEQEKDGYRLLKMTQDVCHHYRSNLRPIYHFLFKDPIDNKVAYLENKIEHLLNPPSIFKLPNDILNTVFSHLSSKSLINFAKVSLNAGEFFNPFILKRANDFSCKEFANAWSFLYQFDIKIKNLYHTVDADKALANLTHLSTKDLFEMLDQNEIYGDYYLEIRNYLLKHYKGAENEALSDEVKQLGIKALKNAYLYQNNLSVTEFLLEKAIPVDTLYFWLDQDIDANLLMVAAARGDMAIFNLLLKKGADPTIVASNGSLPLHFAAQRGNVAMVDALLTKENINYLGVNGHTALYFACKEGHKEVIKLILKNGANLEIDQDNGSSLLDVAARLNDLELIELVLKRGVDINIPNVKGQTALYCAVKNANRPSPTKNSIKCLIQNGADVGITLESGATMLHFAAACNDPELIELVLKRGIDVNVMDEKNRTPMHYAVANNVNLSSIKCLIKNGSDVGIAFESGVTMLHVATAFNDPELIDLVLKRGIDVNAVDENKRTVLHYAIAQEKEKSIKCLIQNGADVGITIGSGITMLHVAAACNDPESIELVLERGIDVNVMDENKRTALYYAIAKNKDLSIKCLLQHNVNLSLLDSESQEKLSAFGIL